MLTAFRRRAVRGPFTIALILLVALLTRATRADETPAADRNALRLTLRGEVFESDPPLQIFGPMLGVSLRDVTDAIRKAKDDAKVAALVLRLKETSLSWTQLQAVRRQILDFRRSGKPTYVHLDAAGSFDYVLASACQNVSMTPGGMLEIPGLSAQMLYMKDLLAKLGIHFEELRMGRYKSAAESFTRSGPSDAVVEEMHSLLDELFEEYVGSIAENRGLKPPAAQALIDRALFSPAEAKEAGLIDRVEYEDEFLAAVRGERSEIKIVDAKLRKSLEIDLSGFAGLMKLMNEIMGGGRKRASSSHPKIAVVYAVGAIMDSDAGGIFGGAVITADETGKALRQAREDGTVQAVVLRVDSPGGSALASDRIWREVRLTAQKKPVVVSMGELAASGGYYISCGASWIVAERNTITGSIGVIGAVPGMKALFDKVGLKVTTISRGKNAAMVSATGEMTPEGREAMLGFMRKIYKDFIDHVAEGRKLSPEAVGAIAEGRIWTGSQALRHGLVDELGGLDTALAKSRELSNAPADCELLILPKPKDIFSLLTGSSSDDVSLRAALSLLPADARRLLRSAEWVRLLTRERVLAVMPATLSIR